MIKHLLTIVIVALIAWRWVTFADENADRSFPNQPIQLVVPYQAGGGSDTFARIFEQALSRNKELNVPIVVVNRPGGSATIGSRYVKDSRPDGYRILCHHEGIIATKLAGTVSFGPEAFEPIAQTASKVLLMIVRSDSKYQSLSDLLKAAQQQPNTIRVGANQGSPAWFICKQLLLEYPGAEFNFIPADGSKRISYLLGNKLEAGVFSLDEYIANRGSADTPPDQNIRAIANFSQTRHPDVADVPTSQEQGQKTHAENAYYFWAPKNTPPEIVERLADAFQAAIDDPVVVEELSRLSIPPSFRRGAELRDHLAQREQAFEKIAVRVDAKLPNYPVWVMMFVVILLVAVIVDGGGVSFLNRANQENRRFGNVGWTCLLLLCGYVLLLQLNVPYAIASTITIFLIGASICHWNPARLFSIAQIALLTSLGTELVFTQLFSVPLP